MMRRRKRMVIATSTDGCSTVVDGMGWIRGGIGYLWMGWGMEHLYGANYK